MAYETEPISMIYQFNKQAGFLEGGYSDKRETCYPIEEMLEGFDTGYLEDRLGLTQETCTPKDISREIIRFCDTKEDTLFPLADVDRFDKHLDAIVFSFGSLFKLNLTEDQIMRGLKAVMKANMTKLSVGTDEHGKQLKPDDFVSPEEELQKILDERDKKDT